jgi:hypothetical protein
MVVKPPSTEDTTMTHVPIFRTSGVQNSTTLLSSGIKWWTEGRRVDRGGGGASKTGLCD